MTGSARRRRSGPGRDLARTAALCLCAAIPSLSTGVDARELWATEDAESSLDLGSTLKASWLLSRAPEDEILYPERTGGASLWRLRFDLTGNASEWVTTGIAYAHRTRMSSGEGAGSGTGILPSEAAAPYRIAQLDWELVDQRPTLVHAHEIDRGFVALHLPMGELTVGRQAVGMGSGVFFGAVDLFAPFSPLEVDREWRRGVDAIRADVRVLRTLSLDGTVAFDGDFEDYAAVGRIRAYVGEIDGAVLVGRRPAVPRATGDSRPRRGDRMVGATLSAVVGEAEAHGEFALYGTDGRGIDGGWLGTDAIVAKGVAGASHVLDIGNGVRLVAEYHYSGFGLADVERDFLLFLDRAFQERLARGDTQMLGRHAVALMASYDLLDDLTGALTWLASPVDGSGMAAPSITWSYSDGVTLVGSAFVPWGAAPESGRPRSEYGIAPLTFFLQAGIYD